MTPQLFLKYQLTLLLTHYGKQKIITELKKILKLSDKEINSLLSNIDNSNTGFKTIKKQPFKTPELSGSTERTQTLKEIMDNYNSKTFLPELKDVKQFLTSNSSSSEKIRNRSDAQLSVLKALSSFDDSELKLIINNINNKEKSSLGIISDEILRKN